LFSSAESCTMRLMPLATVISFYALRLRHLTAAKPALLASSGACRCSTSLPARPDLSGWAGHGRAGFGKAATMRPQRQERVGIDTGSG
jgi:hypothetical protein